MQLTRDLFALYQVPGFFYLSSCFCFTCENSTYRPIALVCFHLQLVVDCWHCCTEAVKLDSECDASMSQVLRIDRTHYYTTLFTTSDSRIKQAR